MTSAGTGWALRWTGNPSGTVPARLALARSTDGARTWAGVTPPAAVALLGSTGAAAALDALSGSRAYLAVTAAASGPVRLTEVFGTGDGGRTWTESAPIRVRGYVSLLAFAGRADGWLVADEGAATGEEPVAVFRTADAGRRWSLLAASPAATASPAPGRAAGQGGVGLVPAGCDKASLAFATAQAGWLGDACAGQSPDLLLVTRDGGTRWAPQPLSASVGCRDGCAVYGAPQFFGPTGFVLVGEAPAPPSFLVSHDLGRTWAAEPLPASAGSYPRITFFGPDDGVLVPAGPQGAVGRVFGTTADGGRTWTAVRSARSFTALGTEFDFISPKTGFAWVTGTDATGSAPPAMAETTDSGRTWTTFTPRLAAGG
jgi:photosystem II stability/assembly factor-like uncharacterized protein